MMTQLVNHSRKPLTNNHDLIADLDELFRITPERVEPAPIAAHALVRVSSTMQKEQGHSLEDQETRIRRFVADKGWALARVFRDPAFSGRTNKRPGLRAMIRAIKAGKVQIIVVDRIDRLSRDLLSLLRLIKLFQERDVRLVSVRENIDFGTTWGRLVLYVLGALAEFYANALSEEIRLSRQRTAEQGRLSGSFRLGYCKGNCSTCTDPNGPEYCPCFGSADRGDGKIRVLHPIESTAVRLMFEWYATGEYSDRDVAQRLNEQIFTLDDGSEVHFRTKGRPGFSQPQAFDHDAVRAILNNPVYAGYVAYYSTYQQGQKAGEKHRKPVQVFPGQHQAIVDLALYRRVQTIRRNRYRRTTSLRNPARVYPLTGILFCSERHSPLRGVSCRGGESRYYVDGLCKARLAQEQWHQKNLRADVIEQVIQDVIARITLPPKWKERILAYVLYDDGMDEIERDKFAIRQRLERALELYIEGEYDQGQLERVKAQCVQQLAALAPDGTAVGMEAQGLLDNLGILWEALTDEEQKTLYRCVFGAIYVQDDEIVTIDARGAFREMLRTEQPD
jgi:site-specific DNA recombinase